MMRFLLSIALIGAALGAATVGMLGLPGRISRKPPVEVYSDRFFPAWTASRNCVRRNPTTFLRMASVRNCRPPARWRAASRFRPLDGEVYAFEDSPVNTGRVTGTTNFVDTNPLPVNEALLQRGRERFDIYCAPCHGRLGDGNGITKKIGVMPAVANLHDKRIVELTDGEIFNTITHGKGMMGAAGPLVPTPDRWAIIAYLRALQLSWLGTKDDLPPAPPAMPN